MASLQEQAANGRGELREQADWPEQVETKPRAGARQRIGKAKQRKSEDVLALRSPLRCYAPRKPRTYLLMQRESSRPVVMGKEQLSALQISFVLESVGIRCRNDEVLHVVACRAQRQPSIGSSARRSRLTRGSQDCCAASARCSIPVRSSRRAA